jgi:hypothetical protein
VQKKLEEMHRVFARASEQCAEKEAVNLAQQISFFMGELLRHTTQTQKMVRELITLSAEFCAQSKILSPKRTRKNVSEEGAIAPL